MRKKWIVKNTPEVQVIAERLGVSELTATILSHRGIKDEQTAKNFLNPEAAPFHDPFLMLGMRAAVDRIKKALNAQEKICVYGDYDVDGMSASAILIRTLKKFGAQVESYIPARAEGYGMNLPALMKISAEGFTLLISVDCGITNEKEISAVKDSLDVIVTDHHLPALEGIKSAVAVVDPNQKGCPYPEKNLCGAGVAFKICQALANKIESIDFNDYTTDIDLAAMATVADLVPLIGENRKIVRMGLNAMSMTDCIGLQELLKVAGLEDKKISAGHIAFKIAPRLNSAGRLATAAEGLKLLLTEDISIAQELAERLNNFNQTRKDIEAEMLAEAEEKVFELRREFEGDLASIVIAHENWSGGVIGLTASKLVERYNLPTIVLTDDGEFARGSCRSIPALHMKNALDTMADLFTQYGGHSQAAGLSIKSENIPELKRRFDDYVRKNLSDEDFIPILNVDALINPTQLTLADADEFEKFKPCGLGNPKPVLACKNIRGTSANVMGKDKNHLSFIIPANGDGVNVRAVAWDMANFAEMVERENFDLAYEPEISEWQDSTRLQCMINYLEPAKGIFPTREVFIEVYKFLKVYRAVTNNFEICDFTKEFNSAKNKNFSTYTILSAINIFRELGFIKFNSDKTFDLPIFDKKISLNNSRSFRLGNKI